MRTEMTDAEVASYRDNGFLVVEGFLEEAELAAWSEAVDNAVAQRGRLAIPGFAPLDDAEQVPEEQRKQLDYYQQVFTQRVNLWQTDARMAELMLDPRLGAVAAQLAGVDGIRMWHDQALIKEPWSNPTGLHLDVPYWSFTSPDAISIWVALDDATLQNGCLCYLRGSHLARKYDNVGIGPEIGAIFEVYPQWRDLDAVACPVAAGGALFHNGLTCHGAGANITHHRRRAMTAGFMPDGSTFNGTPNILRPEQLATLQVGDVLDDESQNPLLWSRTMASAV